MQVHMIHLALLGVLLVFRLPLDDLTLEATALHIVRTEMQISMMSLAASTLGKATAWQLPMRVVTKESCAL